jgi:hypothetical protein
MDRAVVAGDSILVERKVVRDWVVGPSQSQISLPASTVVLAREEKSRKVVAERRRPLTGRFSVWVHRS